MKQHIRAQLEDVSLAVGRDLPGLRQIADDLRIIGSIKFEQGGVMRRDGMEKGEGGVAVAIVIAGFHRRGEFQRAPALRRNFSIAARGEPNNASENRDAEQAHDPTVRERSQQRCYLAVYSPARPMTCGFGTLMTPHRARPRCQDWNC